LKNKQKNFGGENGGLEIWASRRCAEDRELGGEKGGGGGGERVGRDQGWGAFGGAQKGREYKDHRGEQFLHVGFKKASWAI